MGTGTVNATNVSHATLRKLRQADGLSIGAICRQVRQENYREWQAWENRQDYSRLMAGRYDTHVGEGWFTLARGDAIAQRASPLRE